MFSGQNRYIFSAKITKLIFSAKTAKSCFPETESLNFHQNHKNHKSSFLVKNLNCKIIKFKSIIYMKFSIVPSFTIKIRLYILNRRLDPSAVQPVWSFFGMVRFRHSSIWAWTKTFGCGPKPSSKWPKWPKWPPLNMLNISNYYLTVTGLQLLYVFPKYC